MRIDASICFAMAAIVFVLILSIAPLRVTLGAATIFSTAWGEGEREGDLCLDDRLSPFPQQWVDFFDFSANDSMSDVVA